MNQRIMDGLLIRVDERVKTINDNIKEHNKKIDDLVVDVAELRTQMKNHINLHKRDLAFVAIGLTVLTLIVNVVFKFVGV